MPWSIRMIGTSAAVTTAVNALTVPASEGPVAAAQLTAAKTYITGQIAGGLPTGSGPTTPTFPAYNVKLIAFGRSQGNSNGNSSTLNVDLSYVSLNAAGQELAPVPTQSPP